jgi:hypothetical protein
MRKGQRIARLIFGLASWLGIVVVGVEFGLGAYYPAFGVTLVAAGFCGLAAWVLGNI